MAFLIYTSDNRMNMSHKKCNSKRKQYAKGKKPALNENTSRCLFKKIHMLKQISKEKLTSSVAEMITLFCFNSIFI